MLVINGYVKKSQLIEIQENTHLAGSLLRVISYVKLKIYKSIAFTLFAVNFTD